MKACLTGLLVITGLALLIQQVMADTMIYKCKSPTGATLYKKAPCAESDDTVSTWTPKEPRKTVATPADNGKSADTEAVSIKLKQHASGHYFVEGNVDGKPLVFVVDTGASFVSLPEKDAHDAQIYCDKTINMTTANGSSGGCTAKAKKVQFGRFAVSDVEIILAPNLTQPLLGMNVLKLFKLSQDNNEMVIAMKSDDADKPKQETENNKTEGKGAQNP
jgi:clan AA aspartic protease (TIGR02281 family)